MGVRDAIRQELPCMAFHTPHGSTRFRLPWSWSAFDYRTLCDELWAQCDARFEIAKVERREGATSHTDRGTLTAPLIVDALGWRRVLGAGAERAAARGDDLARARGPSRRARRRHRPRRLDRPLADPRRLRLVGAGRRRAARRRRLLRAARPRQGADARDRRPARAAARALPGQLVPARAAPRGRGRRVLRRATAPGTASRSRARGSARRSTSASPAGASCARVLAGEVTRDEALRRVRRVLGAARAGVRDRAARCSG